jgi:hypothetical protein
VHSDLCGEFKPEDQRELEVAGIVEERPIYDSISVLPLPTQQQLRTPPRTRTPSPASSQMIIQFRREELSLESTREAHATHGSVVTFHDRLFVYMSPFAHGEPYIITLMSPEGEPGMAHRLRTATDLASMFVRFSGQDVPRPLDTHSILSNLAVESLACKAATRQLTDRCIAIPYIYS